MSDPIVYSTSTPDTTSGTGTTDLDGLYATAADLYTQGVETLYRREQRRTTKLYNRSPAPSKREVKVEGGKQNRKQWNWRKQQGLNNPNPRPVPRGQQAKPAYNTTVASTEQHINTDGTTSTPNPTPQRLRSSSPFTHTDKHNLYKR